MEISDKDAVELHINSNNKAIQELEKFIDYVCFLKATTPTERD